MRSEDTFFSRVVETKEEASLIQCISNSAETNGLNDRELNLYSKTTTKAPLNKKNLSLILLSYFGEQKMEQVEEITKHLLENREEKVRENVRRKIDRK